VSRRLESGTGLPFCLPLCRARLAGGIALGALDGDGAVAEVLVVEDAADRHAVAGDFLELAEEAGDVVDVLGLSSLRLLPRLLRIFCQKPLASISCTLPLRAAGLRLLTIQT
jgi:hypothetical protein